MKIEESQNIAMQTFHDLETLRSTLIQREGNVNPEDLKNLILKLQHEANQMTTAVKRAQATLDDQLKGSFSTVMDQIRATDTFKQGLGEHQNLLVGVFNRITTLIGDTKFKSKVTRTEHERLD